MTKIRTKILPFILPVLFFLLPWQTRWIFAQNTIGGESFEYGVISLYVVEALVVLAFIIYGRLKICQKYQKAVGFSFLILTITFISMFWAINGDVAFGQFVHVLIAMMLFLLLLDSRTNLRWVSIGLIASLMIPIGLGIWQVVVGSSMASTWLGLASRDAQILGDAVLTLENDTRILRAYGSFSHPNIFGGFLVVGLLSLLMFRSKSGKNNNTHPEEPAGDEGSRCLRQRSIAYDPSDGFTHGILRLALDGGLCRVVWYTAATLLLIGLILTYSQSAWIAIIVGLICGISILVFARRKLDPPPSALQILQGDPEPVEWVEGGVGGGCLWTRFKLIATAFSILIILGSIFGVLILNSAGVNQTSITERAEQYQEWPEVVSSKIVLGSGLGNYTYAIEQLDQTREWWQYQPVHNIGMLVVGEIGILGLVLVGLWVTSIDKLNFNRISVNPLQLPLEKKGGEVRSNSINSTPLLTKEGLGEVSRSNAPLIALMMGCALLVIAGLDHYLWTQWSGLALVVYVMALTARIE